jgi:hypothetical protein
VVRSALVVAFALMAAHDASCDTDSSGGSVNAPCTRPSDCVGGLACTGGVCAALDAGAPVDAAADALAETGEE